MSASPTPEPEAINVARATRAYLKTLESLGLLQGYGGSQTLHSDAHEVLIALHHVLAGGSVSVEIQSPGTASMIQDLNTMLENAVNETNQLAKDRPDVDF